MKKVTVPLADLKETFYVRVALDQQHVLHLKELKETEVDLPRIKINADTLEIVDGRHRKAAYELIGIVEVECHAQTYTSRAEMIADALRCNVGGSLPPSRDDISHTMQVLLSEGVARKLIISLISEQVGFPPKLVQRHLDEVQSRMAKARMRKAVLAVTEGVGIEQAAVEHGVKLESLKQQIAGEVKDERATDVRQLKAWLGARVSNVNLSCSHMLAKVGRDLRDGLITNAEVLEVAGHLEKLSKRSEKVFSQWAERFKTQAGVEEAASKATQRKPRTKNPKEKKPAKPANGLSSGKRALAQMGL